LIGAAFSLRANQVPLFKDRPLRLFPLKVLDAPTLEKDAKPSTAQCNRAMLVMYKAKNPNQTSDWSAAVGGRTGEAGLKTKQLLFRSWNSGVQ
jgi:hypothetical protein